MQLAMYLALSFSGFFLQALESHKNDIQDIDKNCARFVGSEAGTKDFHLCF